MAGADLGGRGALFQDVLLASYIRIIYQRRSDGSWRWAFGELRRKEQNVSNISMQYHLIFHFLCGVHIHDTMLLLASQDVKY